MKAIETLDDIWRTYEVTVDCLKIASRSVDLNALNTLKKTSFVTSTKDEAKKNIDESRANADDYVILSLWTVFERNLFACLLWESKRIISNSQHSFTQKVYQKIDDELEYWRIDDALDIFKTVIDPQIIGQAKQVKQYRDWVAHKNPKKSQPQIVTPKMAHDVLSKITVLLDEHPNIKK